LWIDSATSSRSCSPTGSSITWTDDIARLIGRLSFADVRTDQSRAGKTQEMREPGWWATFFDAAYLMRRKIARDIIDGEDFQEPEGARKSCAATRR